MSTLTTIVTAIDDILDDAAYTEQKVIDRINDALQSIAAGIRMPDGGISPPLPDLFAYGTVDTSITLPYISLPATYQRNVFLVYDSGNNKIEPPRGGGYYSFVRFMQQVNNLRLAETGSIYRVAVKGLRIYYQGIPAASTTLGLQYYRKPATLVLDGDVPEGIPDHLAKDLLKHAVIRDVYGEKIEAGVTEPSRGMQYHTAKFFELLTALCDFTGIDASPEYYGEGGSEDAGACDG
jgi:hypothetical protein